MHACLRCDGRAYLGQATKRSGWMWKESNTQTLPQPILNTVLQADLIFAFSNRMCHPTRDGGWQSFVPRAMETVFFGMGCVEWLVALVKTPRGRGKLAMGAGTWGNGTDATFEPLSIILHMLSFSLPFGVGRRAIISSFASPFSRWMYRSTGCVRTCTSRPQVGTSTPPPLPVLVETQASASNLS